MNDISSIIAQLEHQGQAIDKAISALREVESGSGSHPLKRRGVSAAGRKRISEAAKAYWAKRRTSESKPEPKKRMVSAAARKRMAAAQRKRWAAVKQASEKPKKVVARKEPAKKAVKKASPKRKVVAVPATAIAATT